RDKDGNLVMDFTDMAREIADEVFNKITGRHAEVGVRPEFIKISARGPLKERTFTIPDEIIENFLESDIDLVGNRYVRVMASDIEMKRKFGSTTLDEQIA